MVSFTTNFDPLDVPGVTARQVSVRDPYGNVTHHAVLPGIDYLTLTLNRIRNIPIHDGPLNLYDTAGIERIDLPIPRQVGGSIITAEGYTITNGDPPQPLGFTELFEEAERQGHAAAAAETRFTQNERYLIEEIERRNRLYRDDFGTYTTTTSISDPTRVNSMGSQGAVGAVRLEGIIQAIKDTVEVRTKIELEGTELVVRTRMIVREGEKETVISEDEDSVDLQDLIGQM